MVRWQVWFDATHINCRDEKDAEDTAKECIDFVAHDAQSVEIVEVEECM